jgi:hypothetical protein
LNRKLLTNHVETSHISVEVHVFLANFNVVVRVDTVRSHEETENSRLWIHFLKHVEDTHDDVMTSSSLTTRQHYTDLQPYLTKI